MPFASCARRSCRGSADPDPAAREKYPILRGASPPKWVSMGKTFGRINVMMKSLRLTKFLPLLAAALLFGIAPPTRAAEPIKIGFGMGLTGGLASAGKAALLAMKIWEEETNAKGGLLGRPVQLVYYDDQSNPATVPGIFTKPLEVDQVDLGTGG